MHQPFFSIIIPTYNREKFVSKTILSVLNQSFENIEVIVIDDGSIDETSSVVESIIRDDNRVSYFYQSNSERSVARNNGVKKACGKFLIFLDSDDFFNSINHLDNVYNYIKSNEFSEGLYFTGATIVSSNKTIITRNYSIVELNCFDFFVNESIVPARVCISRNIFNHFKFDEDCIVVEDTVLWTIIMDKYPIEYIPIHSVTYKLHENNSVNILKNNAYKQRLLGLKKLFYKYKVGRRISNKTKKTHINRCYIGIADFYLNNNSRIKSKIYILFALLCFPFIETKFKLKYLFLK
jgi:glycosyltransferase involved in cell wall biosynthesis